MDDVAGQDPRRACASSATRATSASIAARRWSTATTSASPPRARGARMEMIQAELGPRARAGRARGPRLRPLERRRERWLPPGRDSTTSWSRSSTTSSRSSTTTMASRSRRSSASSRPTIPLALNLMRITVDGEPIDDPGRSSADIQRCTDVALDQTPNPVPLRRPRDRSAASRSRRSRSQAVSARRRRSAPSASACTTTTRPSSSAPRCGSSGRTHSTAARRSRSPPSTIRARDLGAGPGSARAAAAGRSSPSTPSEPLMFVCAPTAPTATSTRRRRSRSGWRRAAPSPRSPTPTRPTPSCSPATARSEPQERRTSPLGSTGEVRVAGSGVPPEHTVWVAAQRSP